MVSKEWNNNNVCTSEVYPAYKNGKKKVELKKEYAKI